MSVIVNKALKGAAGQGGGFIIEGSGLFDGGDLSKTPSTDETATQVIFSTIFKLAPLGTTQYIFGSYTDGNNWTYLRVLDTGALDFSDRHSASTTTALTSTQLLRDVGAYYAVQLIYDSTASTPGSGEIKMVVNGSQVTAFSTETYPSQNQKLEWGTNGTLQEISGLAGGGLLTCYMAQAAVLIGTSYGPTDFGEETDDGFWQINDASGLTFGTNGFLIQGGTDMAAGIDSVPGKDTLIAQSDGSVIGNMTTGGGLASMFDGEKHQAEGDGGNTTGTPTYGYAGKDWGSGVTKTVSGFRIYSPLAVAGGFDNSATPYDITISLEGSTDNFSASTVSLGTATTVTDADNLIIGKFSGITTTTAYRYHRLRIDGTHTGNNWQASEVEFYEGDTGVGPNTFVRTGTITATNDSPTNDAANGYGNMPAFSALDSRDLFALTRPNANTLSNGNRTATRGGTDNGSLIDFIFKPGNKYHFEYDMDTYSGTGVQYHIFCSEDAWQNTATIGNLAYNLQVQSASSKTRLATSDLTTGITAFTSGERVSWDIDFTDPANTDFIMKIDGSTVATDSNVTLTDETHVFAIGFGSGADVITINTGQDAFVDTPATDHVGLGSQNLPTPAVINYEDHYYIEADISHTNGATTAVTLPTSVSGGAMARIKRTDSTGGWYVFDTVRGANKFLYWDSTAVEDTATFTDQNLTGTTFTIPSGMATGTYVIEVFYVGVYFQITEVVGNGANRVVSYGATMDSLPGFMYHKNRDTADAGFAFHSSLGGTKYLQTINTNAAATSSTRWNDTAPTITQFALGTSADVNDSGGDNFINYSWANSGPYAFGSHTSNNSVDGPVHPIPGYAQTVTMKIYESPATANWFTWFKALDGEGNPTEQGMYLDTTGAEITLPDIDINSNNFKLRNIDGNLNTVWGCVWMAFGIQPLTDGDVNQGRAR